MGSCRRRGPFHSKDGIGPKSITLVPKIATYNSRDPNTLSLLVALAIFTGLLCSRKPIKPIIFTKICRKNNTFAKQEMR